VRGPIAVLLSPDNDRDVAVSGAEHFKNGEPSSLDALLQTTGVTLRVYL